MNIDISFELNDRSVNATVAPAATLLSVVRETFGLTGTKEGCSEGECGACTVLVDGKPIDSCIYAAAQVDGREVRTVEGMDSTQVGAALVDAFVEAGGVQCGFCTPGFVVTLSALLESAPSVGEEEVKRALAGNICRCTGYSQILDAVALSIARTEAV